MGPAGGRRLGLSRHACLPPASGVPAAGGRHSARQQWRRSSAKAVAEVRGSLSEIRKDVTELQSAVGELVENEKVVQTRLTALEERVSTVDHRPPPAGRRQGRRRQQGSRPRTASRRRAMLGTRPRPRPCLRLASSRRSCPSRPAASRPRRSQRPRRRQRRTSSSARRSSLVAARSSPCSWQQQPLSTRSNRAGAARRAPCRRARPSAAQGHSPARRRRCLPPDRRPAGNQGGRRADLLRAGRRPQGLLSDALLRGAAVAPPPADGDRCRLAFRTPMRPPANAGMISQRALLGAVARHGKRQ